MAKRIGTHTIRRERPVSIIGFAAAGSRCGYSLELDKTTYYFIDMKKDNEYGYDDEDFIRDFWASRE